MIHMLANRQVAGSSALFERAGIASDREAAPAERPRTPTLPIAIMGVAFDNVTLAGAASRIEQMIASRKPHYVVTANVDFLVQARKDIELRRILLDAHLVLCDGTPLVWVSRLLGNSLAERVAGADLVPLLIRIAAERNLRMFFLGATPESNARAVANLRAQNPTLNITGHYAPPFRPLLQMDHDEISKQIRAARPEMLLVSFGCPKQEKWVAMHYRKLGVPVVIGVGATIDFLAKQVRRAPIWMQRSGTEWIFRMLQEPRRLFPRYVADLWHFSGAAASQWWHLKARAPVSPLQSRCTVAMEEPTWQRVLPPSLLDARAVGRDAPVWKQIGSSQRDCLLEMAGVKFIDSTGIALLVRLQRDLRIVGRRLVLLSPSSAVRRALRLMRLQESLAVAEDALDARQFTDVRDGSRPQVILRNDCLPLVWRGEITGANVEEIRKATEKWLTSIANNRQPAIDLAEVPFIDSAGAGLMIHLKKFADNNGLNLQFADAQPAVRNVLQLARLETCLLKDAL